MNDGERGLRLAQQLEQLAALLVDLGLKTQNAVDEFVHGTLVAHLQNRRSL